VTPDLTTLGKIIGAAAMEAYDQSQADYVNHLGTVFRNSLRALAADLGITIQVNGMGSIFNTVFSDKPISNDRDVANSHEDLNELLFMALLTNGVFIAPRGMFCMSTAMKETDIDFAMEKLRETLTKMKPVIAEKAPELISQSGAPCNYM
jgi:glutamate-1-semialdehyde 2,1-aminomutase